MRRVGLVSSLVLFLVATACGGGGDRSAVPGGPGGSSNLAGSLTPDQPTPPPGSVSMQSAATSGNLVVVRFDVTDPSDVYGAAFDVVFDTAMAEYVTWAPGTLLESGGQSVAYQVSNASAGRVVVGASRSGSSSGATATGSQALITLTFRVIEAGTSTLGFQSATLLDSQSPPQPIPGTTWAGATLVAN